MMYAFENRRYMSCDVW